jgi:hypothetical protein
MAAEAGGGGIVATVEDGGGTDGDEGVVSWWPWRRWRGARRGRPHLWRARAS